MDSFSDYANRLSRVKQSYIFGEISPVDYGHKLVEIYGLAFCSKIPERQRSSLLKQLTTELVELESIVGSYNISPH